MNPTWTGGGGGGGYGQQRQHQQHLAPQPTGFFGNGGGGYPAQQQYAMQPQYTGYPGGGGMQMQQQQQPQPYQLPPPQQQQQPMLGAFQSVPSVFSNTFMPNNVMNTQFQANLPSIFQQQSMQVVGQPQVNVQWSLTEDEKKSYAQIFRQWQDDNGLISGSRAQEVFKESGLDREDLMKIW